MIFTPADWDVARTVTVTAVDDLIVDGNISYHHHGAATSTDVAYNGRNPDNISVTNIDNDVAGITVSGIGGIPLKREERPPSPSS